MMPAVTDWRFSTGEKNPQICISGMLPFVTSFSVLNGVSVHITEREVNHHVFGKYF